MIPACNKMIEESGKCADSWNTSEKELVRQRCGREWSHITVDEVGHHAIYLRKGNRTIAVQRAKARHKQESMPDDYQEYLKGSWWKEFSRKVKEFWNWRCAVCNAHIDDVTLDVHHRTYERLGREELTDCVALCRPCHKVAQDRWKRNQHLPTGRFLF